MKKISFGVLSIPLKKILTIIVTILIFENLYSTEPVNFTKAPENLSKELLERTWSFELIGIKHIYISITFNISLAFSFTSASTFLPFSFCSPVFKYTAIIIAEPAVWFVMVIPLIYGMHRKMKKSIN